MTDTAEELAQSWDDTRHWFDRLSDHVEDWQGVPILMNDPYVTLHDRHPLAEFYRQYAADGRPPTPDDDEDDLTVVNHWFSYKRNVEVYVCRDKDGKSLAVTIPRSPDASMDRLTMWFSTLGAADAWDMNAEQVARLKLADMLTDRQWRHYDLTGSFLETSPRSGLTYMFRRLRPTIALTPRGKGDNMKCLAVLCLHPVGYHEKSWGGCMVPSDDVIAHLTMCRGDEAYFWRKANQHQFHSPEAGL